MRTPLLLMGVLLGLIVVAPTFAPTAAATTTIPIDFEKTIKDYTLRVRGTIVIDEDNRTITGDLTISVTNATGVVVFERHITFTVTWGTAPAPITFTSASLGLRGTIVFGTYGGVSVSLQPFTMPRRPEPSAAQLARLQ